LQPQFQDDEEKKDDEDDMEQDWHSQ
jgi:hypothetical protein